MHHSAGIFFSVLVALGVMSPMYAQDTSTAEGQIAFVKEHDNTYSLMVGDVSDLANALTLTQPSTSALAPSVSPDGSLIAFTDSNDFTLHVINPDGSRGGKKIASGLKNDLPNVTGWLPDGSGVLYGSDQRGKYIDFDVKTTGARTIRKEIFVAPVNGGSPHVLGEIPLAIEWIGNWSPDGRWLVVAGSPAPTLNTETNRLVYARGTFLVAADGAVQKLLDSSTGAASFSPDGKKIAIVDARGSLKVYAIDLTQSPLVLGKSTEVFLGFNVTKSSIAWSPDGQRLAVQGYTGRVIDAGGPGFIYFVDADGSHLERSVSTGNANAELAWINPNGAPVTPPVETVTQAAATTVPETATEAAVNVTTDAQPDLLLGCTVMANGVANLREGAGTTFARIGTMSSGQMSSVSAQANGTDGFVWWQLVEGGWVRSDLVQTATDCSTVPVVTP